MLAAGAEAGVGEAVGGSGGRVAAQAGAAALAPGAPPARQGQFWRVCSGLRWVAQPCPRGAGDAAPVDAQTLAAKITQLSQEHQQQPRRAEQAGAAADASDATAAAGGSARAAPLGGGLKRIRVFSLTTDDSLLLKAPLLTRGRACCATNPQTRPFRFAWPPWCSPRCAACAAEA